MGKSTINGHFQSPSFPQRLFFSHRAWAASPWVSAGTWTRVKSTWTCPQSGRPGEWLVNGGFVWKWQDGIMKILDDQHFPIVFPWFSSKKICGFPCVVTNHHYVGKMMGKWWWSGIGSNLLICIDEDHRMRHCYGKSHDKTQGWRVGRSWMIQVCYRPSLIYFARSIVAFSVAIHRKNLMEREKIRMRMRMMTMMMMMMGFLMEQWWCGCWFQRCFFLTMGMGWWSQLSFRRCFRMAQPPAGEVVSFVLEIMGIQWDTNGKWMTCSWDFNRTLFAYETKRPKPSTRIGGNSQNSRTLQIVELLKLIQMTFNCLQRNRRCSGNWWLLVGHFFHQLLTSGEITAHNCYQMDSEMLGKLMGRGPEKLPLQWGGLKHQSYRDMGSWQNIYLGKSFSKTAILKGKSCYKLFLLITCQFSGRR